MFMSLIFSFMVPWTEFSYRLASPLGLVAFITFLKNFNLVWPDFEKSIFLFLYSHQTNFKRLIKWWAAPIGPSRGVLMEALPPNPWRDYASTQMDKMKLMEGMLQVCFLIFPGCFSDSTKALTLGLSVFLANQMASLLSSRS